MITTSHSRGTTADRPVTRTDTAVPGQLPGWILIAGPAVTLAVMLWGAGVRTYSGDEMDTVSAVSRTIPQLFHLLGHFDAVHGFYYLLLWPVAKIAGTGQLALRLPSALAMTAAAAGVTAIGNRLASQRAGLCAGLIFAALPTVTVEGHDARPYAAVTAAAVLASYLLLRAVQDPRPGLFAAYGLAVVLTGYLQLFALLLVPAHAVTVLSLGRWPGLTATRRAPAARGALARRWLITVAAAGLALIPMLIITWAQRGEYAWLARPDWPAIWNLATTLTARSAAGVVAIAALMTLGGIYGGARAVLPGRGALAAARGPDRSLAWLAVPWLLLPPLILVAVSEIEPVYFSRYITFCLPAVALLAGAGLAALRLPERAATLVLVASLAAPTQLTLRQPGGGTQRVAQFLSTREQPGDAIVYPETLIPPWYLAYPAAFSGLADISLSRTPQTAGRLYAEPVSMPVLYQRERDHSRIWVIPTSPFPPSYIAPGFRLAEKSNVSGQVVLLYTRTG